MNVSFSEDRSQTGTQQSRAWGGGEEEEEAEEEEEEEEKGGEGHSSLRQGAPYLLLVF